MNALSVNDTPIPGLFVIDLELHRDSRGWFKENYQKAKLEALGLPSFNIVQNNISFNEEVGVTRGLHAEPWEKFISVATGKVFGVWVDLRQGPTFGKVHTTEITPDKAIFVSRGIANGYQTLETNVAYTYLVNDHWSPESKYTLINLADEQLGIQWPIPLDQAIVSDKDQSHPKLSDIEPLEV
jgi:dTDP-4-dehydrorhamnose 3,5-epimerase